MASSRRLCQSRNTVTGEPCQLPAGSFPHKSHRLPDHGPPPQAPGASPILRPTAPANSPAAGASSSAPLRLAAMTAPSAGLSSGPPADLRSRREDFADLVQHAALTHRVRAALIEHEYWMFQVARSMQAPSSKYPASTAIMYGGSMLALTGIAERLSEDADFNVSFGGGIDNWSDHKGRNLLAEFESRVCADLGGLDSRSDGKGSGLSRRVEYAYPGALPSADYATQPLTPVRSDTGVRLTDDNYITTLQAVPLLGHAASQTGESLPADIAPCPITVMHPITALVDKLDAVSWRSQQATRDDDRNLAALTNRIRDHYDLSCLIRWARDNEHLNSAEIDAAHDHMQRAEARYRDMRTNYGKKNVPLRPTLPRPPDGYHTLPCWQPGTHQYDALDSAYSRLRAMVYGPLPSWADTADTIRSAEVL